MKFEDKICGKKFERTGIIWDVEEMEKVGTNINAADISWKVWKERNYVEKQELQE